MTHGRGRAVKKERPRVTPSRPHRSNRYSVHEALRQKVLTAYRALPINQQKVATALLHRADDLPFLTTESLARQLNVSKATVVRLAQRLGYRGFTELQQEMTGALQMDLSDVKQVIGALERQPRNETLSRVAQAEVQNIQDTVRHLDRQVFQDVVTMLVEARRVYTIGVGVSSLLAQMLAYELNQVALDARALSAGHMRFIELLAFAARGDVVVTFSFPPYSKETVDAAAFARRHGAAVVAVTDSMTAPITFEATKVLVVRTKNMLYTNSIAAISMISNALVTDIALKNKHAVTSVVQEVNRAMEETGQYIRPQEPTRRRGV